MVQGHPGQARHRRGRAVTAPDRLAELLDAWVADIESEPFPDLTPATTVQEGQPA